MAQGELLRRSSQILQILNKLTFSNKTRYLSTVTNGFKCSDIQIIECKPNQRNPKPDPNNLLFGATFSDHMLEIEWDAGRGWGKPHISPLHNFSIHPAAKVFHYAQEIFEGMKAYKTPDNKIKLFRPEMNMKRMNASAERACLPQFDGEELLKCIKKLVELDRDWVPSLKNTSLYIRPTLMGIDPTLGVAAAKKCILFVITSPVGPYFKSVVKPVSLLADPRFVRAWPGGSGNRKMGANYAPTLSIQQEAEKLNLQQVLWLFGPDHNITEAGAMNIFVYLRNQKNELELVTPTLDGTILPGVTRASILELTREWSQFKVSERSITMKELIKALKENRVVEMFGAGTACIVCPIGSIYYGGKNYQIPTESSDSQPLLSTRLLSNLTDIQFGRIPHKWAVDISE